MIDELKTFDLWEQGLGIPPTLPSFYWNVYSYEQRIKEICLRLERMLEYQDVQTDKINECVEQVNKLTEQVEALTKEVARLNQALLDEIEARKAGDQKLETELQKEINDRIKAINDEATTRQAQVDKLTADLQAEAQTRQEQVNKLTSDLTAETTARTEADRTLQGNIDTETTNRESADTTLQTNIDKVASDLTTETNDRYQAISGLDTRVTQNTNQIADEVTARTNLGNSLTEAITNETTARETKDNELDQKIANLTSGMPSVESDNIFTASTKVPTVNAIQASSNQAVTATNKLATMADVGSGGGGGTTVNSIAPLTVDTAPTVDDSENPIAIGDNAHASVYGSVAIGYISYAKNSGVAIGKEAKAIGENNTMIGAGAYTADNDVNNSVALGYNSNVDYSYTVSVGRTGLGAFNRRITCVADPLNDDDAVNLKYLSNTVNEGAIESVSNITHDPTSTTFKIADKGLYACTFYGNVPAGQLGDAYGFNILDGTTIIGTVAGFRGATEQTNVPLIGNVILVGDKNYTFAQTGITTIITRRIYYVYQS